LQNERYAVSTESGSDLVTILAISILAIGGDPVKTVGTRSTKSHEASRNTRFFRVTSWIVPFVLAKESAL